MTPNPFTHKCTIYTSTNQSYLIDKCQSLPQREKDGETEKVMKTVKKNRGQTGDRRSRSKLRKILEIGIIKNVLTIDKEVSKDWLAQSEVKWS